MLWILFRDFNNDSTYCDKGLWISKSEKINEVECYWKWFIFDISITYILRYVLAACSVWDKVVSWCEKNKFPVYIPSLIVLLAMLREAWLIFTDTDLQSRDMFVRDGVNQTDERRKIPQKELFPHLETEIRLWDCYCFQKGPYSFSFLAGLKFVLIIFKTFR